MSTRSERRGRIVCLALVLAGAALLPGCVTRKLFIQSTPPGAAVRLDGLVVGETPFETTFSSWGSRELELELDGHVPRRARLELERPWWQRTPVDLFTDLLLPFHFVHEQRFAYVLEPLEVASTVSREDARAMVARVRERWRREIAAEAAAEDTAPDP